jgi:hypothetical protein
MSVRTACVEESIFRRLEHERRGMRIMAYDSAIFSYHLVLGDDLAVRSQLMPARTSCQGELVLGDGA